MNGAGNKVGIETDPESSQEQDCLSCSTVMSSKVSADPRQTHRTCCVVGFYSPLISMRVSASARQVKRLLLRAAAFFKGRVSTKNKAISFDNEPNADNMSQYLHLRGRNVISIRVLNDNSRLNITRLTD